MGTVHDLSIARGRREGRLSVEHHDKRLRCAPADRYREVMAQVRGIRRVRGFESDPELMALLRPAYDVLVERGRMAAPSPAIFNRDLKIARRCKTG